MRKVTTQFFIIALCAVIATTAGIGSADGEAFGQHAELSDLRLLRSTDGHAVVRFGNGPLTMITVGDRLGRRQAEVKAIGPGRLVLEAQYTAEDGMPQVELIILTEGQSAAKRYLRHAGEAPPMGTRPLLLTPPGREGRR